ncbi:unnamed protein product [Discula destructiva]
MNRDIPGYWFCPLKKKYFRIESSRTAPADSFYNAANISKRKLQQEQADKARKRRELTKHHVKRAPILSDPMTGVRLLHELRTVYDPELPNKSWLTSLQHKGDVALGLPEAPSVDCMLVNGDDTKTGMAIVYAATHGARQLRGCYVPCDRNDHISFDADPLKRLSRSYQLRAEPFLFNDITSISYHKPSRRIMQTSKVPGRNLARISMFEPLLSDTCQDAHEFTNETMPHPAWLLGETQSITSMTLPTPNLDLRASCVQPSAHGNSTLNALVATSRGVIKIDGSGFGWLGPTDPSPPLDTNQTRFSTNSLSVDWHPTHPSIVYAGDRNGKFFHIDMRVPYYAGGWNWYRHRSSVAHVRGIDDFQILAAGPKSAMAVYDVRRLSSGARKEAAPVCTMHGYTNPAHINLGLDLVTNLQAGEGVVAAASSAGTVDVFSLRTGAKMRAGALDELKVDGSVFKCLQWETMPGDKDPSLWVGVGHKVQKYTFGLDEGEDGML